MTLSRAAFERGVRRLDGPAARTFVSDLLDDRGYRTTVEGRVVTATSDGRGSMRLLVVADGTSLTTVLGAPSVDAVLVTGGPVTAAAASVAVRAAGEEGRAALLGAETLYEWFAYAVDEAARTTLVDRYFDATDSTVRGRAMAAVVDALAHTMRLLGRGQAPSRRSAVVVTLVGLLAVVAAATAGPLGSFGPTATTHSVTGEGGAGEPPGITAIPATAASTPAVVESGATVPDACPRPPVGAHPASLRPGVIETASVGGLEGWRVLLTQNLSEYDFDPNDQRARIAPERRHVAVFETAGGARVRLGIDRWESTTRAAAAVARGGPWGLVVPWGPYVAWVEWRPRGEAGEPAARQLLAAVRTPGGVGLGAGCVSALGAGPTSNSTA